MRPAVLLVALAAQAGGAGRLASQGAPSRFWRPEERLVIPDLSRVTAVAATQGYVFAATREALAVYERTGGRLRSIEGPWDGFPGPMTTMVADPSDDTAWMGGGGVWAAYHPFARRWDAGALPGLADLVALDAGDPARGAYFRAAGRWYFVAKHGLFAEAARSAPSAASRIAPATQRELLSQAPGIDAVRLTIERDAQLRATPITSAAVSPVRGEAWVGTDGNGVFRVDLGSSRVDRLPAGLLGSAAGALALEGDEVCVGTDERPGARHGLTCFRADLSRFDAFPGALGAFPGTQVRRLALTSQAVWAATNAGLVRLPRGGGRERQFLERDGLPSADVRALAPAPDGLWVGTSRGLAVAPDDGGRAPAVRVSFPGPEVLALAVTDDTLWIGSADGLLVLMPGSSTPLVVEPDARTLREPVVALAAKGDTIVGATETRLVLRAGGRWQVLPIPGTPIGRFTAAAADADGFWLGGTSGLAFFQPARGVWRELTSTGDLPLPVTDVAAAGEYVWVATPGGVVRLLKRAWAR